MNIVIVGRRSSIDIMNNCFSSVDSSRESAVMNIPKAHATEDTVDQSTP